MMVALVLVATSFAAQVPETWNCDDALYADGTCDCGCGALDEPDCGQSREFTNCVRSGCALGRTTGVRRRGAKLAHQDE
jgi:hypothetical protein